MIRLILLLLITSCMASYAIAFPINPTSIGVYSAAGGADTTMQDVIASAVADLDATKLSSYSGSGQTWSNIIEAPADSESQTAYDFFLGADGTSSTDDPTFTGSAGDSGAYFSHDGSDMFKIKNGNTSLIAGLHRDNGGSPWWFAIAFRTPSSISGFSALFGTSGTGGSGSNSLEFLAGTVNSIRVNVTRGGSFTSNNFGAGLSTSTDYLVIISGDPTVSDDLTVWVNTSTGTTDTDMNASTSSTDTTHSADIGSRGGGGGLTLENGYRVYGVSIGNEYIDDTKAGLIIAEYEARHNRDYTP